MWKCPNCETFNQGQTCVVCGAKKVISYKGNYCPNCGNEIDVNTGCCECCIKSNNEQTDKIKHKNITPILVSIILCLLLCLVGICCYFVFLQRDNDENDEMKAPEEQYVKIIKDQGTTKGNANLASVEDENAKEKNSKTETSVDISRTAVEDVENKVLDIRNWYNDTQNNLSFLSTVETAEGVVKYYNEESSLIRVDVPADENCHYTRYYYFKDDILYFAFVFDGQKENRLYFYDEMLFRWIDENGVIHDNELNNEAFMSWERKILEELAFVKINA